MGFQHLESSFSNLLLGPWTQLLTLSNIMIKNWSVCLISKWAHYLCIKGDQKHYSLKYASNGPKKMARVTTNFQYLGFIVYFTMSNLFETLAEWVLDLQHCNQQTIWNLESICDHWDWPKKIIKKKDEESADIFI